MDVFSLNEFDVYVAVSPHEELAPPPMPPYLPHVEGATLRWGGFFAKVSPNVFLQGAAAIQLGHDVGGFVPHCPIPPVPPNLKLPAIMALSSCKALFGKSRVLLNGTPAAWHLPVVANLHVCADPLPLPLGVCPSVLSTTVKYGFSWDDLVLGYADIHLDQSLSFALREAKAIGARTRDADFVAKATSSYYDEFVETLAKKLQSSWTRTTWPSSRLAAPSLEVLKHFLDKGGRAWLKKLVGKTIPKARGGEALELLGDGDAAPEPPPPVQSDPSEMFEDGLIDEIPLLGGENDEQEAR